MFRWLKSRFEKAPSNRVAEVSVKSDAIECRWPGRSTAVVPWDEVQRVLIRTTDKGPFDDDVFFVLETSTDSYVISQQAPGTEQLLGFLQELAGFDNMAFLMAMGYTENRDFLCWDRARR